jgi:alpha-L-fucosidase
MPPTSDDPLLKLLYANIPREECYEKYWLGKLTEVIDGYRPDIIWFDSWLDKIPDEKRRRFAAYYLNRAVEWGKEVVITYKQEDLPKAWASWTWRRAAWGM